MKNTDMKNSKTENDNKIIFDESINFIEIKKMKDFIKKYGVARDSKKTFNLKQGEINKK